MEMGGETALERLEALSRVRPLTDAETRRLVVELNRASRRHDRVLKGQKPWTTADLLRLRRHLLNGKKPAQIGPIMNRSERAIWRKMTLMGWTVHAAQLWVINPAEGIRVQPRLGASDGRD
jgi:hypothetical protein